MPRVILPITHHVPNNNHPWKIQPFKEPQEPTLWDHVQDNKQRFMHKAKQDFMLEEADNMTANIIEERRVDFII